MDSYAIGGRKRAPSNHTVEDQALDQIAKQVCESLVEFLYLIFKKFKRRLLNKKIDFVFF